MSTNTEQATVIDRETLEQSLWDFLAESTGADERIDAPEVGAATVAHR